MPYFQLPTELLLEKMSEFMETKSTLELVNDNLIGYEGLISLKDIDPDTKLYDICHRFLFENKVQTGDEKLDEELNMVIKGVPEFINIIGKTQHKTHNYSLDIHSLLVLANSINNPQYKNLNASDRAVLKIACLTHDLAKKEGVVDKGHQMPSALYAKSIASRYFKEPETIDRIYELIKNHHWLEEFNNADDKKAIRKLAFNFRRKNDFELAKVFADSINKNCIPLENFKGYDYRVLNFNETDDKEDLSKYGFEKGKTKKDVRFLVHMVEERGMKANLETFTLSNKTFSGKELKQAITEFQDSLLNNSSNNEIVGCTPKIRGVIAKVNSLEEIPTELLNFARENDLPVVLINNDEDSHDFY